MNKLDQFVRHILVNKKLFSNMSLFKYIVAILVLAAALYLFYSFTKKKEEEKLSQNVKVLEIYSLKIPNAFVT